jgi:hypothetical protein
MKKILIALGGMALALIVLAGAFVGYTIYVGGDLGASSQVYVDRVVPEIVSTWSAESLKREASTELSQQAAADQIDVAFRKFTALGHLVAYRGSKGYILVTPRPGKIVTAKYEAGAKFEQGDAVIDVDLVQRGGRWQVLGFLVKSDQLLK